MLNQASFIGRLVDTPKLRVLPTKTMMTTFVLAVDRPKNKDGEIVTDFPFIICFGKMAEIAKDGLEKGSLAYVQCKYQTSKIVNNNGICEYRNSLICNRIDFIKRPEKKDQPRHTYETVETLTDEEIQYFEENSNYSEELPFD